MLRQRLCWSAASSRVYDGFLSRTQIHKAKLSGWGAAQTGKPPGTVVAVKVRHPGVSTMMQRDFVLMQRAAALSAKLPVLRDLNLEESVRQFGAPLREQLDLASEVRDSKTQAKHLFRSVPFLPESLPVPLQGYSNDPAFDQAHTAELHSSAWLLTVWTARCRGLAVRRRPVR